MNAARTVEEAIAIVENYAGPAEDFEPAGFEQSEGFRVYRYKEFG